LSVSQTSGSESYSYDADGERVKVVRGSTTTIYLEGLWEEVAGGVAKAYYSFNGQTAVMYTSSPSAFLYLHNDHLGSASVLTGASGTALSQQEFDPWGKVRSTATITQTNRNFTGQVLDGTGLLYYHARYYDPGLGRFVSADTIVPGQSNRVGTANPQNLNRYSYVTNNPVKNTDPTGHDPMGSEVGDEPGGQMPSSGSGSSGNAGSSGEGVGCGCSGNVPAEAPVTTAPEAAEPPATTAPEAPEATKWNNGWRTPNGKYGTPQGPGRSGGPAEDAVERAINAREDGWKIIGKEVTVRNGSGAERRYDFVAESPSGRNVGIEVKSGSSPYSGSQRAFDKALNSSGTNTVPAVGKMQGTQVRRAIVIRLPDPPQ
jgi:RHS repeat-associated protein